MRMQKSDRRREQEREIDRLSMSDRERKREAWHETNRDGKRDETEKKDRIRKSKG